MSRVLRRPMFRGGYVDSEGTGITSGLDTPKRGLVDGPGGYAGELSFGEKFKMAMEQDNANKKARSDMFKSDKSYNLDLNDIYNSLSSPVPFLQSIYDAINPSAETILKRLQERQAAQGEPIIKTQAYREEQKRIAKAKAAIDKENDEKINLYTEPKEDVTQKVKLPTLAEDIDTYTKLLLQNAGPDKDEYTRQKYLTLAKFGLNLLKPTPAGIKPSLLSSAAAAAEKPLEEYANISMQQSKEDRALRQAAAQIAIQQQLPGNTGKAVRDLMTVNPNMTVEEAISIVTTGKNKATLQKEERLAIDATRSRLETNPNLKGLVEKDPATLNLFAKLIEKGNVDETQIKGDYNKYNKYVENSYYHNVPNPLTGLGEVARYSKGKFYYRGEPGFVIKQKGI